MLGKLKRKAIALLILMAALGCLVMPVSGFADPNRPTMPNTAGMPTAGGRPQAEKPMPTGGSGTSEDYVLGIGDRVRVTVFGEPDLSGDMDVSSTGMISMPLVGDIKASGNTVSQIRSAIIAKLKDGYMKDPKLSMDVMSYRPFFIVGEVMKPGSYNYVNGMTVINAVALAGGYTYRADKDGATVRSGGSQSGEEERKVAPDAAVGPGDVITIPERFF
jgi:protein involved in polysaccharide export with SLBB domain